MSDDNKQEAKVVYLRYCNRIDYLFNADTRQKLFLDIISHIKSNRFNSWIVGITGIWLIGNILWEYQLITYTHVTRSLPRVGAPACMRDAI